MRRPESALGEVIGVKALVEPMRPPRPGPVRAAFSWSLAIGAGLVVLVLATPIGASPTPAKTWTPPFVTAHPWNATWTNRSGGTASAFLSEDLSTGKMNMSLGVYHRACPIACHLVTSVHAILGAQFHFRAGGNGTRQILANWSISWVATAMIQSTGTYASASGRVVLVVFDRTTGTHLSTIRHVFVNANTTGGSISTGCSGAVTITSSVTLIKGHTYSITTYLDGLVYVVANSGKGPSASLTMSGPRGANLNWVTVR